MKLKTQLMTPLRAGAVLLALTSVATVGVSQAKSKHAAKTTSTATASTSTAFHAAVSKKQAKTIVLARFPGKVVGKITLENEEGKMQYAVNVRSGKTLREVMVDATTGTIVDVEVTTAGKEKAEAKAETTEKKSATKPEAAEKNEAAEKGEK